MCGSGLLSQRHCRRWVFRTSGHYAFHLPGTLRSTSITRLHHYYGSSDSCRDQSSRQVSLLHEQDRPAIPPPTTWSLRRSLSHVTPQRLRLPRNRGLGFATRRQARQTTRPNRVHLRCGLAVRLTMLPTPPRGDAVSIGYRPENVYLKRTSTSLSLLIHKRTFLSRRDPAKTGRATRVTRHPLWSERLGTESLTTLLTASADTSRPMLVRRHDPKSVPFRR